MTGPLLLTGSDLTPSVLREVAFGRRPVALTPDAAERAAAGRAIVERALAKGEAVYGLTTGLGSRVGHKLSTDDLADFSARTVRGRAHGVGPPLPAPLVRAMMVARLNVLLNGGAGVSFGLIELLRDMLNADLRPVVPSIGSIGAGDLCLMAHLGLAMIGEGEAELGDRRGPAAALFREAGLQPATLGPKDGLGLINCSALGAGIAAVALEEADAAYRAAQITAALSFEGFRANVSPLEPEAVSARPQPGQAVASAHLRRLLFGSLLLEPGNARRVQDPISLRCVGSVHGALLASLGFAERALDPELNGAPENPLLLLESERAISTGNFHTPLLALALDQLALAAAQLAANTLARGARLMQERFSGLPSNLIARDAGYSGFAPVMKVGEALLGEIRHLAQPVSGDLRWGADGTEDDVTNTPLAGKKLLGLLERLRHLQALELMLAAQAVELAHPSQLGQPMQRAYECVRDVAQPLVEDRPLSGDLRRLSEELLEGRRLLSEVEEAL